MQIGRCSEELHQYAVITALGLKVLSKYLHWGLKPPNFLNFDPFQVMNVVVLMKIYRLM